jgi:hypothetical protein
MGLEEPIIGLAEMDFAKFASLRRMFFCPQQQLPGEQLAGAWYQRQGHTVRLILILLVEYHYAVCRIRKGHGM